MNLIKKFKLEALAPVLLTSFALAGCVAGENQQFFSATAPGSSLIGLGNANLTAPSVTPTATPSGTPNAAATATPVPTAQSPIAVNDGPYEMAENKTLTIQESDLLSNDSDPANLAIHFDSFQAPTNGTLVQNGATLTFTPAANFLGTVTFTYRIANTLNLTADATVTINVRAPASQAMYGDSSTGLYSYDPNSNAANLIATFTFNGVAAHLFDIAITPQGLMYGLNGSTLYYVNAANGHLTVVPTAGIAAFGNINGLTALSDGRLVISGDGVAIYNIATQILSTLVAPGGFQSSGDIIALPDGFLYMAATSAGADHLIRINPSSGTTQDIGSLGTTEMYGLGFAYNVLYGFDSSGAVYTIDPATAQATQINNTGVAWYGATTNPVLW
jgi:hypothetical protein